MEQVHRGVGRLLDELAPLFALVQRRLRKVEGAPVLRKDVRVQIEDLDQQALYRL